MPQIFREHVDPLQRAEAENENRGYRRFERQIKESSLPGGKTLRTLEEACLPEKVRRQLPRC